MRPTMGEDTVPTKPGCPVACTYIYEPVCATNGTHNQVFGNECAVRKANCYTDPGKCNAQ